MRALPRQQARGSMGAANIITRLAQFVVEASAHHIAIMDETAFYQVVYAVLTLAAAAGVAKLTVDLSRRGALKRPPHAWTLPWLGDSMEFFRDPVGLQRRRHKKLGEVYRFTMMGKTYVQIGKPHNVKRLLASEGKLVEGASPLSFELLLGSGSFVGIRGDAHTALRKLVVPAFTQKAIVNYLPRLVTVYSSYVRNWMQDGHVNAHNEMTTATFKIAVEVILGFDDGLWFAEKEKEKVLKAWQTFLVGLFAAPFLWLKYIPGSGLYTGLKARGYLAGMINQSLDILQKQIDTGGLKNDPDSANVGQTILTQTDENGNHISRSQAIDLCVNILFAGHETTAKASLILLRMLKEHPENIDTLREEQKKVIAAYGHKITEAAIKDMEYLDACVKEIMRLEPVVTAVIRDARQDFEMEGYQIRKGDMMWLELKRSMKETDPRWNQDKEFPVMEYHPKRWFSERGSTAGLLTFGSGARLCPGQNLAFMELKVLLTIMLRQCEWTVDLNEPLVPFPIVTPVNGMPMDVKAITPPMAPPLA